MDDKLKRKKYTVFIIITLFFFASMLFLFSTLSSNIFNNAIIKILVSKTDEIYYVLANSINNDTGEFDISKNINTIKMINSGTSTLSFKIYSKNKKQIFKLGQDIVIDNPLQLTSLTSEKYFKYNKTKMNNLKKNEKNIYQVIFTIVKDRRILGYGEIIYDIDDMKSELFQERRLLIIVITVFSLFIYFFLIIMILNLQKRVFFLENEIDVTVTIDKLTGLYTKDHFIYLLKKELERIDRSDGKFCLITIDIDSFSYILEKYDLEFGDLILATVAKITVDQFRNFDIIGRFGDDEIIILMVDSNEDEGYEASERCRKVIEENKFYFEGNEITITASFGIASTENTIHEKDEKSTKFFRTVTFNSLNALARAKRSGKNKSIRYTEMNKPENTAKEIRI